MSIMKYISRSLSQLFLKKAGVPMASIAKGSPTKEFFVEMLTRDIELNDAILDLLDNCLDGVVRSCSNKDKLHSADFYASYSANISISATEFSITDNCGGIPRETAENYAFRMGRVPTTQTDHPTIGIYGIGMKRAIFKIGRAATVYTQNEGQKYAVKIPCDWADTGDWDFPIEENPQDNPLDTNGTRVHITALNQSIAELWNTTENLNAFVETLKKAIQESYSLIIQKGFTITINDQTVTANPVELLVQKDGDKKGIRPYVFSGEYDDVSVKVAIGFYAPMASDDDIDEMNESKRSSHEAGITVVCNDRVVLYNDKSGLTGWGTSGVPNYHTQFIGIKGIVVFESTNPKALPMTTTKRGIDHSSALYIAVKDKICEGLKMFTNYTNQWKGRNAQERTFSTVAQKVQYSDLFTETAKTDFGVSLRKDARGYGQTFRPTLPVPENEKPFKIIRYSRNAEDIKLLVGYFYGDKEEKVKPSLIGEKCFDKVLEEVKRQEV